MKPQVYYFIILSIFCELSLATGLPSLGKETAPLFLGFFLFAAFSFLLFFVFPLFLLFKASELSVSGGSKNTIRKKVIPSALLGVLGLAFSIYYGSLLSFIIFVVITYYAYRIFTGAPGGLMPLSDFLLVKASKLLGLWNSMNVIQKTVVAAALLGVLALVFSIYYGYKFFIFVILAILVYFTRQNFTGHQRESKLVSKVTNEADAEHTDI